MCMKRYLILSYHLLGSKDFHSDLVSTKYISFFVFLNSRFQSQLMVSFSSLYCFKFVLILVQFNAASLTYLMDFYLDWLCFDWISRRVVQWCAADQSCGGPLCARRNPEQQPEPWTDLCGASLLCNCTRCRLVHTILTINMVRHSRVYLQNMIDMVHFCGWQSVTNNKYKVSN